MKSHKVLVAQSCLTLCNPVDCSPPGSSIHGILQARILEWVATSLSRGSSWPRDWIPVSCIAGRLYVTWALKCFHSLLWQLTPGMIFEEICPKYECFCVVMNCPCSLPRSSTCTMAPPKGHVFRHLPHVPGWHCQFLPLYWIFPVNIQACCLFSYLQPVFINELLFIFKLYFSVCSLIISEMYNMMTPLTIKIMTTSVTPEVLSDPLVISPGPPTPLHPSTSLDDTSAFWHCGLLYIVYDSM